MEWLNYHHLHYFWLAAKEGGISRAAKKLHLAQPTLSSQIRALGESLGGELFERRGRGLVLTELGTTVYRHADEIFSIGRDLLDAAKGRSSGRVQRLVVGIADVLPKLAVYRMLAPALRLTPPVRIVCREDAAERLVAALGNHEVDLVLSDSALSPSRGTRAFNHLLGRAAPAFRGTEAREQVAARLSALAGRRTVHHARRAERNAAGARRLVRLTGGAAAGGRGGRRQRAGQGVWAGGRRCVLGSTAIEAEIVEQYAVGVVGRAPELKERYFAISLERRIRHPGVLAISSAARELLSS